MHSSAELIVCCLDVCCNLNMKTQTDRDASICMIRDLLTLDLGSKFEAFFLLKFMFASMEINET